MSIANVRIEFSIQVASVICKAISADRRFNAKIVEGAKLSGRFFALSAPRLFVAISSQMVDHLNLKTDDSLSKMRSIQAANLRIDFLYSCLYGGEA